MLVLTACASVWITLHFPLVKRGPFQERRNQKSPGQNKITKREFLNHMACLRKMHFFVPRKPSLYPISEQKSGAAASIF